MPALTAYQIRKELRSLPGLKIARSPIQQLSRRSSTAFWIKRLVLEDDDDDDDDDNLIKEIQAVEKAEKAKELKTDLLMLALNQAAANAAPNADQGQFGARPEGGAAGAGASATIPVSSVAGESTAAAASSTASSQESATATSSISAAEATKEGSHEAEGIVTAGKKGLHPGAIAGIVIGSLLLVILVVILIYRKTQVNKRLRKRSTWAIKPYDFDDAQGLAEKGMDVPRTTYAPSTGMEQTGDQPVSLAAMANPFNPEPMTSSTGTPFILAKPPPGGKHSKKKSRGSNGSIQGSSAINGSHSRNGSVTDPLALPPSLIVTIPTPIINGTLTITNPDLDLVSIPIEQTTVVPTVTHGPSVRVIKYSYTPTRDDEMAVELGDELSVLTQYDDGWAMCKKLSTDAQGMVPVACWEDDDGSDSDYEEEQVNHSKRINKMLARGSSLRRL